MRTPWIWAISEAVISSRNETVAPSRSPLALRKPLVYVQGEDIQYRCHFHWNNNYSYYIWHLIGIAYSIGMTSPCPAEAATTFSCVIMTPFGFPVVPEVYIITAKSSGEHFDLTASAKTQQLHHMLTQFLLDINQSSKLATMIKDSTALLLWISERYVHLGKSNLQNICKKRRQQRHAKTRSSASLGQSMKLLE